jgi:hypothetical protein
MGRRSPTAHPKEVATMSEQFTGRVDVLDSQGRAVFQFDSAFAVLDLGATGNEGDLRLRGDDGNFKIHLDGGRSLILVNDTAGRRVLNFDGNNALLDIGGQGNEGDLRLFGDDGTLKIHLDAGSGDITLTGADCAEDFETDTPEPPEPGSVMTIGERGRLRPCTEPYDKRAAGVISGAGSHGAAIVLDRHAEQRAGRSPLALSGKVFCKVDAGYSPIEVGDLLTTSPTIGHAMKASEPARAFGATIGKALQPLVAGAGLVPILVALQ